MPKKSARITFVVHLDSAGVPVDLCVILLMYVSKFGAGPGGGEVLSPTVVKTNNGGQAAVNLTSGTKAGVVQIILEITIRFQNNYFIAGRHFNPWRIT
ncbi:MAG: hypothetical protein MZV64_62015 [Ignavibacteriales bacterium]|nr:hypothetical protein [Ignavibacteriales bacterium]